MSLPFVMETLDMYALEDTETKVKVMNSYLDGHAIECYTGGKWADCSYPIWDWHNFSYRVKISKPSINWDHVSPKFNYLFMLEDGSGILGNTPSVHGEYAIDASIFASYVPGTCDHMKSLVERPRDE